VEQTPELHPRERFGVADKMSLRRLHRPSAAGGPSSAFAFAGVNLKSCLLSVFPLAMFEAVRENPVKNSRTVLLQKRGQCPWAAGSK